MLAADVSALWLYSQNAPDDVRLAWSNGVQMKIWECFSGLTQQTWYYTGDDRIALQNEGERYPKNRLHIVTHCIQIRSMPGPHQRRANRWQRHANLAMHGQ